jgi:hypothetical protein
MMELSLNTSLLTAILNNRYDIFFKLFETRSANKHIFFVGDSLMRYQYLCLVHSLHYKEFLNDSVRPNPVGEKTFSNWFDFYNTTNTLLQPNEWCDCYRDDDHYNDKRQFENRYYTDASLNVTMTYIQFNGMFCHGHWSDNGDYDSFRSPLREFYPAFWTYGLTDTFLHFMKGLISDNTFSVLILNAGAHAHFFSNEEYTSLVRDTAHNVFEQIIWKTNSARDPTEKGATNTNHPHDLTMCSTGYFDCMNLSWTEYLNGTDFVDLLHFKAHVYNYMNVQLMYLLK